MKSFVFLSSTIIIIIRCNSNLATPIIIITQESGVHADSQVLLPLSGFDLPLTKGKNLIVNIISFVLEIITILIVKFRSASGTFCGSINSPSDSSQVLTQLVIVSFVSLTNPTPDPDHPLTITILFQPSAARPHSVGVPQTESCHPGSCPSCSQVKIIMIL